MSSISYAITAHNEVDELIRLLNQLVNITDKEDEIIVQLDTTATMEIKYIINEYPTVKSIEFKLNKDFASFKNNLKNNCTKDYIFFIDADEYLSEHLLKTLKQVLDANSDVDCFAVPRVNTVDGLTQEHIQKWRWNINDKGRVNWPDYQTRICKNDPDIKWIGKVHERLQGWKTISNFPSEYEDWALIHPKNIERQEIQNNLYSQI
jgi:glycosyltransferase involved in cell wall biosynthesis